MDPGAPVQQSGYTSRMTMMPIYQTIANIFESIYNGAHSMGDTSHANLLPKQVEAQEATKRLMVLMIIHMSVWSDEEKILTKEQIKSLYKMDIETLMIETALATKKAKMMGYLESSATSFYEQMSQFKKDNPKK